MKFSLLILTIITKIIFIKTDCNYITIGANTDKCAVIDKEDKTKSCCFVKIKKNDYTITYCTEIKNSKEFIKLIRGNLRSIDDCWRACEFAVFMRKNFHIPSLIMRSQEQKTTDFTKNRSR